MSTVALALPLAEEERLAASATRFGHEVVARCSGAEELAGRLAALRPEYAVVASDPQYLSASLLAACDRSGVRLVVIAEDVPGRRLAGALGIVETVEPGAWDRLLPAGRPIAGTVSGSPGQPALDGPTVALDGPTVALADADTHAASIAPALGLLDEAPGFAAACRLAGTGSLSRAEFERVAEWVPLARGGLSVLTGLGRPSRWPELTAERVTGALDAARDWVARTVVDTAASLEHDEEISSDLAAPRRNAATLAALRAADRVVAVAAADPVGLARFLRGHAELIELVPPERVTVVVNKVRSSAVGLNPGGQLRQTLSRFGGIEDPALVPWDPAAFDAALLSGRPLPDAAPRSAARLAVRALVRERLLPPGSGESVRARGARWGRAVAAGRA